MLLATILPQFLQKLHINFVSLFFLLLFLTDTAAILRSQEPMWPGVYALELMVKDQQGHACQDPQKVKVQVCTCDNGVTCGKRGATKGAELGAAGIGLLLLGLLLLLREC